MKSWFLLVLQHWLGWFHFSLGKQQQAEAQSGSLSLNGNPLLRRSVGWYLSLFLSLSFSFLIPSFFLYEWPKSHIQFSQIVRLGRIVIISSTQQAPLTRALSFASTHPFKCLSFVEPIPLMAYSTSTAHCLP